MNILIITQNSKTITLLIKYLGFNKIKEESIYVATTKEEIELLMGFYDFDLIFSEGFERHLSELEILTIRLISRRGKSSLSKLDDEYITKPVTIHDINNIIVALKLALAA
jgi:hypothetical protein